MGGNCLLHWAANWHRMMMTLLLLLLFTSSPAFVLGLSLDTPCADQLQRCGLLVEEFERQLQDLKNAAFRGCFTNSACIHEKIAFDDCFAKSLQAIRAPFGDSALLVKNDFLASAEDFRVQVEQCFSGYPPVEEAVLAGGNGTRQQPGDTEDVSHLGRVVFSLELIDRLWGLPAGELDREQLMDPQGGCTNKQDAGTRVFGGGISRLFSEPGASQLTNLNTSCTLTGPELACYRRALDHDPQYKLLMSSRDRALRSCLQNARLQSESNCQLTATTQERSCICNSREALDARMQSALIGCVQHSPVAQLYSALVSLSNGGSAALMPLPSDTGTRFKPSGTTGPPLPATSLQISEEPLTVSSSGSMLTQGSIVSGQCLCACPQQQKCQSTALLGASNDYGTGTSRTRLPADTSAVVVSVPAAQTQQQQLQQQQQQQQQQQAYRPLPWYYQPMQTALSAEAGIANGFERFFNGQPPLKRKKRGQWWKNNNGRGKGQEEDNDK